MAYFFFEIFFYIVVILSLFIYFNRNEITILENIILLFVFNICMFSLYHNINIIYTFSFSLLLFLSYKIYILLYHRKLNDRINNGDQVFINRGIINFNALINENYSYDKLITNLRKKGINNPSLVDYCIKRNNELIIFNKNVINNYPISLIIDGIILNDNLLSINKTYKWLLDKIDESNLNVKNINFAYYKNKELHFITNS